MKGKHVVEDHKRTIYGCMKIFLRIALEKPQMESWQNYGEIKASVATP